MRKAYAPDLYAIRVYGSFGEYNVRDQKGSHRTFQCPITGKTFHVEILDSGRLARIIRTWGSQTEKVIPLMIDANGFVYESQGERFERRITRLPNGQKPYGYNGRPKKPLYAY